MKPITTAEFLSLNAAAGALWRDRAVIAVGLAPEGVKPFKKPAQVDKWVDARSKDGFAGHDKEPMLWRRPMVETATDLMTELVETYKLTPVEAARRVGAHRSMYYRLKNAAIQRGRCTHCGQLLPAGFSVLG